MRSAHGMRPFSSSGGSRDNFRCSDGHGQEQPSIMLRRAQIYALNRRMKAVEEKRWQCCVAGKQKHVNAILRCAAVFSRCAPAPSARRAPRTNAAGRHTVRTYGTPAEEITGRSDAAGRTGCRP